MAKGVEQPIVRILGYALLSAAAVVAVTTLRLMSDGSARLQEASLAMEKGDRATAIAALEDAAKAYVPGGRHVPRALRELSILAGAAEMRGEEEQALKAWESVRRSILATRHFYQPHKEELENAEKSILRIREKGELAVQEKNLVKRPEDPSPFLSLILFVGLVSWIGGALFWVLRPACKDGSPLIPSVYPIATCLGGLLLWLLAAWIV